MVHTCDTVRGSLGEEFKHSEGVFAFRASGCDLLKHGLILLSSCPAVGTDEGPPKLSFAVDKGRIPGVASCNPPLQLICTEPAAEVGFTESAGVEVDAMLVKLLPSPGV